MDNISVLFQWLMAALLFQQKIEKKYDFLPNCLSPNTFLISTRKYVKLAIEDEALR